MQNEEQRYNKVAFQSLVKGRLEQIQTVRGKLNQTQIASEAGISQSTVSAILNGPTPGVRYGEFTRFIVWLGISPNEAAQSLGLYQE